MRGARSSGRMGPHIMRNQLVRQYRQAQFRRSTVQLSSASGTEAEPLNGRELMRLQSGQRKAPQLDNFQSLKSIAVRKFIKEFATRLASELDIDKTLVPKSGVAIKNETAKKEIIGSLATGLGMIRDIDGNVIHLDDNDSPFVILNGETVYVRVFRKLIEIKGGTCTVVNPDGLEEVLLVEPMPIIRAPDS